MKKFNKMSQSVFSLSEKARMKFLISAFGRSQTPFAAGWCEVVYSFLILKILHICLKRPLIKARYHFHKLFNLFDWEKNILTRKTKQEKASILSPSTQKLLSK
jgi:hypothetical protein